MTEHGQRLFISRAELVNAHLGPDPDAPAQRPLLPGQVRLAVEAFSLTANNITYAAFGEVMKYWQFFPAGDAASGCLPVWGFATVAESQAEGAAPGSRVWGYYPAGTHLVVAPSKVSASGFVDGSEHRRELAAIYNQYVFCDADPGRRPELEGLQAVLRPLFMTAFLIDDFLAENGYFGASQVLLSSASSKTAQGTAYCLSRRRGTPCAPRIVGLTSAARAEFVRSLGCYDTVLTYDELTTLEPQTPTVYLDFAGDAELRRRIHSHFADALMFSSSIGGTHWSALGSARDLPGPRPVLFFAPAQAKARSAPPPQGWGAAELQRRMGQAWAEFIGQVHEHGWVRIVTRPGAQAALQVYGEMLAGRADAREGLMLDMRG
ncbi:MAG: hypothetical protein H6R02_2286 [Burkholderiaceae bacterium]|nr:hypothetical protein [Burkholderiaceae bacterium]